MCYTPPHERKRCHNEPVGLKEQRTVDFAFTEYFETKVLVKRPYLTKDMCIRVVARHLKKEMQDDGERVRFWAEVAELDGRFLRVITLADEQTITMPFQTGDSNHENRIFSRRRTASTST